MRWRLAGLLAMTLLLLATSVRVRAQTGGLYQLTWHNIGAAGASRGGAYSLNAAIGQPDAGAVKGGSYTLAGGFFASPGVLGPRPNQYVYLPFALR